MVLQLRVKGAKASHFLHRQEKSHVCVCVFVVLCGCSLRGNSSLGSGGKCLECLGQFSVGVLWRSWEVLAVGLSDFGGQTRWSWRSFPDLVLLWLYSTIPSSIKGSYGSPTRFQADTPCFIDNFHSFSTAQCNPRADPGESVLGWSRLALAPHYQNLPNPAWSAAAFWESWAWSSPDWPRSLLRPSPQHRLSFVLIPT